ncbi:MAG: hypothetical protein KDH20_15805 [Rhodocyclaceae bacterium]|nr:hypothetical protein [Rhodocyclaceae bacterium]
MLGAIAESARMRSISEVSARARQWAVEQGLRRAGMSKGEYMRALAEYRAELPTRPRPDAKQWARDIVARHAAGFPVQMQCLSLANEALGRKTEPTLVQRPDREPRPDAKDREAGDMEHVA